MYIQGRPNEDKKAYTPYDDAYRRIYESFPRGTVAVSHASQYTTRTMLFHERTRRIAGTGFVVIGILVILSMILLYFPALWQR
jgi:hypothetical protein